MSWGDHRRTPTPPPPPELGPAHRRRPAATHSSGSPLPHRRRQPPTHTPPRRWRPLSPRSSVRKSKGPGGSEADAGEPTPLNAARTASSKAGVRSSTKPRSSDSRLGVPAIPARWGDGSRKPSGGATRSGKACDRREAPEVQESISAAEPSRIGAAAIEARSRVRGLLHGSGEKRSTGFPSGSRTRQCRAPHGASRGSSTGE